VAETTTGEQIKIWKEELAIATADQQWRRALQLCSWLRYAMQQQGLSAPEVEEAHCRAKEALIKQVASEKTQREHRARHRQQQSEIMYQIIAGQWEQALDSVDAFCADGATPREAFGLLQELKARSATLLSSKHRQVNRRAAALGQRFDELWERVRLHALK